MHSITRRHFVKTTSMLGTGFLIAGTHASAQVFGANERFRIAVVGLNGRGKAHIRAWLGLPGVEIAYLVDPDQDVLNTRMKELQEAEGGKTGAKGLSDIRIALEDKNLDAVSIAAPNHWHSLMTIWAAQAGKHVYVEKPMSHSVHEGRIAVEAQKKYGVVVQHGTQRRSDPYIAGLTEAIQNGTFGRLKIAHGYACKPRKTIGYQSFTKPPAHLDWDLWRGPANIDGYHSNYVHYNWHWFWKTGNGDLNNQGTHQLDVARWAIDKDQTHPTRVTAIGERFQWQDQGETPNTLFAVAEYPNGQQVHFNVRNVNHDGYERQVLNEYYFEDGGRIVRDTDNAKKTGEVHQHEFANHRYFAKGSKVGEPLPEFEGNITPGGNWASFVSACRAGDQNMVNGNAEDAHNACVLGHLMNNSYRLGSKTPFEVPTNHFGTNDEALEQFSKIHTIMSEQVGLSKEKNGYILGPNLSFNPETERHEGTFSDEANQLLANPNRKGFEVPSKLQL